MASTWCFFPQRRYDRSEARSARRIRSQLNAGQTRLAGWSIGLRQRPVGSPGADLQHAFASLFASPSIAGAVVPCSAIERGREEPQLGFITSERGEYG
jgi:hypothetical protein